MNSKTIAKGTWIGSIDAPNVLEFFWDYCCPYSAKSFVMIYSLVIPMIEDLHPGAFRFVFSHQVQPWHPQSTMMHESAIAVRLIDPTLFYPYSKILFERQMEFFDYKTYNLSRSQIYECLVDVAKEVGVDGDKLASRLA